MADKTIEIKLTSKQIGTIKKFLAQHKIKCDGQKEFALIAEPKMMRECLFIRLLSTAKWHKLDKFFNKEGFYNGR